MTRTSKLLLVSLFMTATATAIAQGYGGPSVMSAPAVSSYAGPSMIPHMTARQLLASGVDDQYAVLTGKLIRHAGGEDYFFSDRSGEIQVEISPKYFPANQIIDANTAVVLTGKFDKERFGTSKLEVKQVILVVK